MCIDIITNNLPLMNFNNFILKQNLVSGIRNQVSGCTGCIGICQRSNLNNLKHGNLNNSSSAGDIRECRLQARFVLVCPMDRCLYKPIIYEIRML